MPVSPARAAAFDILMRVEITDAYASELLHSERAAKLSPADHRLTTELAMGVLRWRGVLDEKIAELSSQALARLDIEVITALRMGAYQLLFLDRIPAHAAINESVELVKKARKRSATGLVNAILRNLRGSHLSKIANGGAPNPELATPRSSHPQWLVERWERSYGLEVARKICAHNQLPPPTALHITVPRGSKSAKDSPASNLATAGDLFKQLRSEGIELEPGKILADAAVVTKGDISSSTAFREHRLTIQDEASQLVAMLLGTGRRILDCCAAPGGKTRILAERNPGAQIVAVDLHPHRAALLKKLVPSPNVHIVTADARTMRFATSFDRILVDAPCSGTGTLARNPEIKWRLQQEDVLRLQNYQIELLRAALAQVSAGGRVVYSTCSLEPEENEAVVEKALASGVSFRVVDCHEELERLHAAGELAWTDIGSLTSGPYLRTIPGVHPCDGFFAAILEQA